MPLKVERTPDNVRAFAFSPARSGQTDDVPPGAWHDVEDYFLRREGTLAACAEFLHWSPRKVWITYHKRLPIWRTYFEICKTGETADPTIRFKPYAKWFHEAKTNPRWHPAPDLLAACLPSKFQNRRDAERHGVWDC